MRKVAILCIALHISGIYAAEDIIPTHHQLIEATPIETDASTGKNHDNKNQALYTKYEEKLLDAIDLYDCDECQKYLVLIAGFPSATRKTIYTKALVRVEIYKKRLEREQIASTPAIPSFGLKDLAYIEKLIQGEIDRL